MLFKHSMRAALTPLVTMAGLDLAGLHGRRDHHRDGVQLQRARQAGRRRRPRPTTCRLIVGLVLLLAAFVIVANIIVDMLYAVIDPRVRVG